MRIMQPVIVLAALIFTAIGHSAVPPLSQEDREDYSSNIVTGKIINIKQKFNIIDDTSEDKVYSVTMLVSRSEKGSLKKSMMTRHLKARGRKSISFTFWKASKRPAGWCGPMGQMGMIEKGDHVRAYLRTDESGNLSLIEPNGFDRL